MVIFLNADGSCENVTPEHVYQGSNNVNEITVVAPFSSTTTLLIGFILPNGLYWESSDGATYAPMQYVPQSIRKDVGVWRFDLPQSVTELQGELSVAINALTAQGNTTSYLCRQRIEESVLPSLPSTPEPSVYDMILQYLGRLNGPLVKSIQKVEGTNNAITYTDNSGVISAPIVLGDPYAAPLPVNTASTLEIPASAWLPIEGADHVVTGYTYTLTAAQHGQMRDGATARDLWVSFDEQGADGFRGVVGEYTVSAAGDITVSVTERVSMTVRVWNGKSIVDETARNRIETETQRAEQTEAHLQEQITELQNTGVDTTARAQIEAETQRAETAEQALGESITAEQTRAEAAETLLGERIAAEQTRAEAAESTLREQIASETARAKAEETSLGERIAAEQARAETAEAGLRDNLTEVTTNGVRNQKVAFTLNGTTLDITTS